MSARARAFALSWTTYASYYLGRKGFSVVKSTLAREQGLSTGSLAAIDTVFLVAYAVGQLPSGIAVDRWSARRVLSIGLCGSALACALFGASTGALALALCFALNGAAQATGWPGTTKIMAEWTAAGDRGRIMGLWSTCYQVGGIASTALATFVLAQAGWRFVFWVPAAWLLLMAAFVRVGLRAQASGATRQRGSSAPAIDWRAVLREPILYGYGACYFCIKLIRYSLLFWLPYYLHAVVGFDVIESGYLSTGFEVGGVLGSIGLGYISDRSTASRTRVAAVSLLSLGAALFAYASVHTDAALWHFGALALVGALLFGPDALISGPVAQEAVGPGAAASTTGFVNGLGSAGAMLQGAVTVGVQQAFGWNALLFVFVGLSLLSALFLVLTPRARNAARA
jgi:sugar phosphate permease